MSLKARVSTQKSKTSLKHRVMVDVWKNLLDQAKTVFKKKTVYSLIN